MHRSLLTCLLALLVGGAAAFAQPATEPNDQAVETPPLVGPGIVHLVHVLAETSADDAATFRERVNSRAHEIAGAHHHFVGSIGEVSSLGLIKSEGPVPSVAGASTLIIDDEGMLVRTLPLAPKDAKSMDAVLKAIDEVTTSKSVDEYNLPKNGRLAIQGYDPVAYFVNLRATRGNERITSRFQGVTYRFASKEHRARFVRDPLRYLPTYGGWCASAMGDGGRKVEIDPKNFKIKDDRLFLFYKSVFADARKDWDKNEKEWEPAADGHWRKISGEDPVKPLDQAASKDATSESGGQE